MLASRVHANRRVTNPTRAAWCVGQAERAPAVPP